MTTTRPFSEAYARIDREYPRGDEREYMHSIVKIIEQISLPSGPDAAVGLYLFLKFADFEYDGFSTADEPVSYTNDDDAFLVAAVLGLEADRDAIEAKVRATDEQRRIECTNEWVSQFEQVPGVKTYNL